MINNYLSDDEEYNTNTIEEPYEMNISYDKNYIEYDSNEESTEIMDEEEKKEYLEYQEYLKKQQILIWENNMKKTLSDTSLYFKETHICLALNHKLLSLSDIIIILIFSNIIVLYINIFLNLSIIIFSFNV